MLTATLFVSAFFATSIVHRLREREQTILKLEEERSRFMRIAAHQLRAPISAIQSFLKVILGGYVTEEKQKEMLQRSVVRTGQLLELVKDLLELARARTDRPPTKLEPRSLGLALRETVELYSAQAEQKGIHLSAELPDGTDLVRARNEDLKDIFGNLISNAIKYAPQNGDVRIAVKEEGNWLVTEVQDTGIGVPMEELPLLFEEFFRASNVGEVDGTGLGLSIVKERVTSLHGDIYVESEPGKGTKFTVKLPKAK